MPNRVACRQLSLFPKDPTDPRDVAAAIGLDWWAAKKLYDDGWLSFNPEISSLNDDEMESEFIFLGSLVSAGCTPRMLRRLLEKLEKPYLYDVKSIYYDWPSQTWKDLPSEIPLQQTAEDIINELEAEGDKESLTEIQEILQEAIDRLSDNDQVEKNN